eukprot:contig_25680_g6331
MCTGLAMVCVCAFVCASTSGFGRGHVGILVLVLPRASRTFNGAPRLGRGGVGCATHPHSAKKTKTCGRLKRTSSATHCLQYSHNWAPMQHT